MSYDRVMYELARVLRRARNIVRIGKTSLAPNETTTVQGLQVKINEWELLDNVQSVQHFGFTGSPPIGSDAIILCLGGDNFNSLVVGTNNNQLRPTGMKAGESIQYDSVGQSIHLSQAGGTTSIIITGGQHVNITATTAVSITCPMVTINGSLTVTGDVIAGGISLDHHTHGDVENGSGTSGPPVG